MKYTCTTVIDLPLEKVVALWNNEEYFDQWQDGFESIVLVDGEKNQAGSRSKITIQQGRRKLELTETILVNNLPAEKKGLYQHKHMSNTQSTRFEAIAENRTRHTSVVEYIHFSGFIPRLIARMLPHLFEQQSQKWMEQFKYFAENFEPECTN
jgi:uncharacterized membrane protein